MILCSKKYRLIDYAAQIFRSLFCTYTRGDRLEHRIRGNKCQRYSICFDGLGVFQVCSKLVTSDPRFLEHG